MIRCLIFWVLLFSGEAWAGWLISPSLSWQSFSFRPEETEPTPNYYSYAPGLSLGYSIAQVIDLAMWGQYAPSQQKNAAFFADDAVLYGYGGELGFRIAESVFIGLRGGPVSYQLFNQTKDYEVGGRWSGTMGGASLGAIFEVSKIHFWQLSLDMAHAVVTNEKADSDANKDTERRIDVFSVTLSYVFNGNSSGTGFGFLGNFLDSLSVF